MSHECLMDEVGHWYDMAASDTDEELIDKLENWKEFQVPLMENNYVWRRFCRIIREEAHKRGLKIE